MKWQQWDGYEQEKRIWTRNEKLRSWDTSFEQGEILHYSVLTAEASVSPWCHISELESQQQSITLCDTVFPGDLGGESDS